jgi:monothiol glutaredoxin
MSRQILDESLIHPAIRATIRDKHADIVGEVQAAVAANRIVVVGMRINPFPKKARKALDALGAPYAYLEYGSYFGQWKPRTGLKMWTGWTTFPMIFIDGTLIGGASELQTLIDSGEFARIVANPATAPAG